MGGTAIADCDIPHIPTIPCNDKKQEVWQMWFSLLTGRGAALMLVKISVNLLTKTAWGQVTLLVRAPEASKRVPVVDQGIQECLMAQ